MVMLQVWVVHVAKTVKKSSFCLVNQISCQLQCEYRQILNETFYICEFLFSVYGREVFFHLIALLTHGGKVLL